MVARGGGVSRDEPPVRPGHGEARAGEGEGRPVGASASRRAFSPLLRRILLVNILPLAILVGGLLYLDQYRRSLIAAELDSLRSQAELIAAALGEGAVSDVRGGEYRVVPGLARQMVRRLGRLADARARLFAADGALISDSRTFEAPGGFVQIEELPPPAGRGEDWLVRFARIGDRVAHWFPRGEDLPLYRERAEQRADDYSEVVSALDGEADLVARRDAEGYLVLSAGVPVQRFKKVLGAVMLSKGGEGVEQSLRDVRLTVLELFAVVLMVTVLLSVYLARTIARPLLRLAAAAETVRHRQGREGVIPDLTARGDEIGDLSAALRDMTEALWLRMDAIERFAADVAHEIKNPLTSLQSAVETAARIDDADRAQTLMQVILEDVQRINRLVSDISDASRVDAELSRACAAPIDLWHMLATMADVHRATAPPSGPRLVLANPEEGASIEGELVVIGIEDRLVQVFRNVINNAISFSPPDGTITIRLAERNGFVEVAVEDQGSGLLDAKLEAVFERFYTERPAAEKFGVHSGLGLSISRQIVEVHGGFIRAENRRPPGASDAPPIGARFVVRLPRAPADA